MRDLFKNTNVDNITTTITTQVCRNRKEYKKYGAEC